MLANILPFVYEPTGSSCVGWKRHAPLHVALRYDPRRALPLSFMYQPGRGHGLCSHGRVVPRHVLPAGPERVAGRRRDVLVRRGPDADAHRVLTQALKTLRRTI